MANQNAPDYLDKIKTRLFENLRMLPHAPGVQSQPIPEDAIDGDSEDEDKQNPDERISIRASEKRISREDDLEEEEPDVHNAGRRNQDSGKPKAKKAKGEDENANESIADPELGTETGAGDSDSKKEGSSDVKTEVEDKVPEL